MKKLMTDTDSKQPDWYTKMLETDGAPALFTKLFEIEETVGEINTMLGDSEAGSTEHAALLARRSVLDRESAANLIKLMRLGLIAPIELGGDQKQRKLH